MVSELDVVTQLLAFEQQQAIRSATHQQVAIQPDALLLSPVQMAGEDTTLHAVAIGRLGGTTEAHSVPEPRWFEIQAPLLEGLSATLESYFRERLAAGSYPQVWVTSGQVFELLDTLSDRYRFHRERPAVARLGQLLSYLTERRPVAGQQALHTATDALNRHWATGMPLSGRDHLGVLLAWIDRDRGVSLEKALEVAEQKALGARTTPTFDDQDLQPKVAAFNGARRDGRPAPVLARHAEAIHRLLAPQVLDTDAHLRRALRLLQELRLPPLPDLAEMEAEETWRFQGFMTWLDNGGHWPVRDRAPQAARRLDDRIGQLEAEAGSLLDDRVQQARQELTGHLIRGVLESGTRTQLGRKVQIRFDVVSQQRLLRLREGEVMVDLQHPGLAIEVRSAVRVGATMRLSVEVTAGMRAVGLLPDGTELLLSPGRSTRGWLQKQRQHLNACLAANPWTHDPAQSAPPTVGKPRPADPLSAVEALR